MSVLYFEWVKSEKPVGDFDDILIESEGLSKSTEMAKTLKRVTRNRAYDIGSMSWWFYDGGDP